MKKFLAAAFLALLYGCAQNGNDSESKKTACVDCAPADDDDDSAVTDDDDSAADDDDDSVVLDPCPDIDGDGHGAMTGTNCAPGDDHCDDFIDAHEFNWTIAGCSTCVDKDADGFGDNCDQGADCDDLDAAIHDGCAPVAWYDVTTGLTWQNPPLDKVLKYSYALDYCDSITLAGETDWRMPTLDELRSLVLGCAKTTMGGSCNIAVWDRDACSCSPNGGPAAGIYWNPELKGVPGVYQSATEFNATTYWFVAYSNASLSILNKSSETYVRCVR